MIKSGATGKFRVPVTEVVDGNVKTRVKGLTAKQMLEHDIVKECDPTLYLEKGEKLRVFQGGDSSYLPAYIQGLAEKHDVANRPKNKKIPKLNLNKKRIDYPGVSDYHDYEQNGLWDWPFEETDD